MSDPRRILAAAVLGALLTLAAGAASAAVEVYRPSHRAAEELAVLAGPLLGPDGAAVPDPQTGVLLLQGEPAAIRRAVEVLRGLDVPAAQYRIESRSVGHETLRGLGVDVSGWVRIGDLRVGRIPAGGPPQRPRAPRPGATLETRTWQTAEHGRFAAHVVVAEGRSAEVWTGTDYPVRVRVFERGGRRERVLETSPLVPVRSGFSVTPRSLADGNIELEITPVQSGLDQYGNIVHTGASTRVRLADGETVAIASFEQSAYAEREDLLGAGHDETQQGKVILVSAQRLTPLGDGADDTPPPAGVR